MPSLGAPEILVILIVALLVFGPKRLPEVGRQVAKGYRELRKFQDTIRDEIDDVLHLDDEEPARAEPTSTSTTVAVDVAAPAGAALGPGGHTPPAGSRPSRFRTPGPSGSGDGPTRAPVTASRAAPDAAPAGSRPPARHRPPRRGGPVRGDAEA